MRMTRGAVYAKRLVVTLLASALVVGMAAVAAGASSSSRSETATQRVPSQAVKNSGFRFAYANASEALEAVSEARKNIEKYAKQTKNTIKSYNNDLNEEKTLSNARIIVQDDPDLVFEYNALAGIGSTIGNMFAKAKIPCIAINVAVPKCSWFNLVNRRIGADTAKVMVVEAKKRGWNGTNTVIILVQAAFAGDEVNSSVRYFYSTIANSLPGFDKISPEKITATTTTIGDTGYQVDGKGTAEPSFTAVTNLLQGIPSDKNIILYGPNDGSSLGGWRALDRGGRADQALVAGLGGGREGLRELQRNPRWIAEGDIFTPSWGQYLLAMGVARLNGVKLPPLTTTPQVILTKKTVRQYYRPGKFTPYRLPPLQPMQRGPAICGKGIALCGNAYLAKMGILQQFGMVKGLKK